MSEVEMRQAANDGALDLAGDLLDRLEIARRSDRKAGLDYIDPESGQLLGDLDLLGGVQRDAGRLLSVPECRVEDMDAISVAVVWCAVHWLLLPESGVNPFLLATIAPPGDHSPRGGSRRSRAV
jgi:hypothetical protein